MPKPSSAEEARQRAADLADAAINASAGALVAMPADLLAAVGCRRP